MQECDKRNSHISSKLHMTHISSNNHRHPVTRTFTPLHYTCRHLTSFHLNFPQLHFTTLSFGLNSFKFPTFPFILYFRIFSAYFFITFLSPELATSISTHVPMSLARIMMTVLFVGIVLSVCTC
jgi:hypothetical protein